MTAVQINDISTKEYKYQQYLMHCMCESINTVVESDVRLPRMLPL